MGKGNRNRQTRFEDKQVNPQRYEKKKQHKPAPRWLMPLIAIVLAVAIVAAIVVNVLINGGVIYRHRILIKSQSGEYDVNQQMAAFIVWQNMYQSAYYEWMYVYYGIQEDTNNIKTTYKSPTDYAVYVATNYTTNALRNGVESLGSYMAELVAGADAGVKAGLKLTEADDQEISSMMTWLESVRSGSSYTYMYTMKDFLKRFMGTGVKEKDVTAATKLMAMYSKYKSWHIYGEENKYSQNDLLSFMAQNPGGYFSVKYREFTFSNLKNLPTKNGDSSNKDAITKADQEIVDRLLACRTEEEFKKLSVDLVMEAYYEKVANDVYLNDAIDASKEGVDKLRDAIDLSAALTELGISEATYTSDKKDDIDSKVAAFIFGENAKKNTNQTIVGSDGIYLIHVYEDQTSTGDGDNAVITAKAGWKLYAFKDYYNGEYKEQVIKDLLEGKNTTDYQNAATKAAELLKKLKDNSEQMPADAVTDIKIENAKSNTAPSAIIKTFYPDSNAPKVAVGDYFQSDDDGISYISKVTAVEDGTKYTITYFSVENDPYVSLFDGLWDYMIDRGAQTEHELNYPTTELAKDSYQEWFFESTLTDAEGSNPALRNFARKANDVKDFTSEKSDNKEPDNRSVYFVVSAPSMKKDTTDTVYGGYLIFKDAESANAAKDSLPSGDLFEKLYYFKTLTSTTGSGDSAKTNEATVDTDLTSSGVTEKKVSEWLFDKNRQGGDMEVIEVSQATEGKEGVYYLALYISRGTSWERTAKDAVISDETDKHLAQLVKDGGYALDTNVLDKLGELVTSAETESATSKKEK